MTKFETMILALWLCGVSTATLAKSPTTEKYILVALDSEYILETGHKLSFNQFISLEDERELDLHLPDGTTAVLKGPADGRVDALLKGKSRIKTWAADLKATLFRKSNDKHVLVTRGNGFVELWRPTSIPVPFSGNFCIQDATKLSFFRSGSADKPLTVEIHREDAVSKLRFPIGKDVEVSMPEGLAVSGNFELVHPAWFGEYEIKIIELGYIDVGSLARAGCTYQLENYKRFMAP